MTCGTRVSRAREGRGYGRVGARPSGWLAQAGERVQARTRTRPEVAQADDSAGQKKEREREIELKSLIYLSFVFLFSQK
jgi:hypothetical protein